MAAFEVGTRVIPIALRYCAFLMSIILVTSASHALCLAIPVNQASAAEQAIEIKPVQKMIRHARR